MRTVNDLPAFPNNNNVGSVPYGSHSRMSVPAKMNYGVPKQICQSDTLVFDIRRMTNVAPAVHSKS